MTALPDSPLAPLTRLEVALLTVILVFGLAARSWQIETLPPGFYFDEAAYALDAQRVQAGARDVYFEANNGREPLFIYTLAAAFSLWGSSLVVVRATAAVFGTLALVGLWAAARALFGPRLALMAAGLLAGSLWALVLSRIGLRAATLPFVECLFVACAVYAWRIQRARGPSSVFRLPSLLDLATGATLGLLAYTYLAARLIPLALIATAAVALVWRKLTWADARWAGGVVAVTALVAMPMMLYAATRPELYFGRATQVGVGSVSAVIDNLIAVAGMFVWRGDENWRHNLPGRPVFDALNAILFVAGLGLAIWRVLRARAGAWLLVLTLWAVLLIPTVLSDRAPHFLRAIGALPFSMCFPALALVWAGERLAAWGRSGRVAGVVVVVAAIGVHGGAGVWTYFGPYATAPDLRFAFETAALELAQAARDCPAAHVDRRLLERFPSIRFVAPQAQPIDVDPLVLPAGCTFLTSGQPIVEAVAAVPGPILIRTERAGLDRVEGATEGDPYPLYLQVVLTPFQWPSEVAARYANGVDLLAVATDTGGPTLVVTTTWGTAVGVGRDWQSYVHIRDAQGVLVSQVDAPLGGGLLPASTWAPGDGIIMVARLPVAQPEPAGWIIAIGLYDLVEGTRVPLRGSEREEYQLPWPDR